MRLTFISIWTYTFVAVDFIHTFRSVVTSVVETVVVVDFTVTSLEAWRYKEGNNHCSEATECPTSEFSKIYANF